MEASNPSRRDLLKFGLVVAPVAAIASTRSANAAAKDDVDALNSLLKAEYNAINTYVAAKTTILDPATNADPLFAIRDVVVAVALSFVADHTAHAAKLDATIKALGGTPFSKDDPSAAFAAPTGFVANIKNVIDLAANAEKAAAIAYTNTQNSLSDGGNAEIAAAIGGTEAQHFMVLLALSAGLVTTVDADPGDGTDVVPKAFISSAVGGGNAGLDKLSKFEFIA